MNMTHTLYGICPVRAKYGKAVSRMPCFAGKVCVVQPEYQVVRCYTTRKQNGVSMWKSIENSVKHLSNPHVAIAVVALAPWLVIALLAILAFAFLRGGI